MRTPKKQSSKKNVYNGDTLAGILTEKSPTEYVFRYDDKYFADSSQPAISVALSKRKQEYVSDCLFPFFTNLLPEGANRKSLCTQGKIDEYDFFGMLMAVRGWDFIGDVSIK